MFLLVFLPFLFVPDYNSKMSGMFAILHVDTCGDFVKQVSEVTSSHVKILQPSFSAVGDMILKFLGFPVKVFCDAIIFKTRKEFLTLHVYLVPPDGNVHQVYALFFSLILSLRATKVWRNNLKIKRKKIVEHKPHCDFTVHTNMCWHWLTLFFFIEIGGNWVIPRISKNPKTPPSPVPSDGEFLCPHSKHGPGWNST